MSETTKKKGGVQLNGSASTDLSRELDDNAFEAYIRICFKYDGENGILAEKNLSKKIMTENGLTKQMSSDGGMVWKDDILRIVLESKTQGTKGNAHERWCDNHTIACRLNNDVMYITLCSGEGYKKGNGSYRFALRQMESEARIEKGIKLIKMNETGQSYRHKEFNILYDKGQSWFYKDYYTVEDIYDIMEQAIQKLINEEK